MEIARLVKRYQVYAGDWICPQEVHGQRPATRILRRQSLVYYTILSPYKKSNRPERSGFLDYTLQPDRDGETAAKINRVSIIFLW